MKNQTRRLVLSILACMLLLTGTQPMLAKADMPAPEEIQHTPVVLLKEVTENTTMIPIYVYDDTILYIKNGNHVIYQKSYEEEGLKNVKIAKQAGGSKLKIYLVSDISGKKGDVITRKVVKLPTVAPEPVNDTIQKPKVQKSITNKTTKVSVIASKGTTLVIKNEKKTLKTVKFKRNEKKKITIPAQKSGTLYFYLRKGKGRSQVVSRTVQDVIAPKTPKVKMVDGDVYVKGEVGTKIYFKGEYGWREAGAIFDEDWKMIMPHFYDSAKYYQVHLKDMAGNKSKVAKVKNSHAGSEISVFY